MRGIHNRMSDEKEKDLLVVAMEQVLEIEEATTYGALFNQWLKLNGLLARSLSADKYDGGAPIKNKASPLSAAICEAQEMLYTAVSQKVAETVVVRDAIRDAAVRHLDLAIAAEEKARRQARA